VNTPQFDWVKNRLPRQPQPVPPVYQPEVVARAVVWATQHPQRELYVGWPTVKAIVGNQVAPGFADRYLARTGYDSQQRAAPDDPGRRDNLWNPLPGDHGAHGDFDHGARRSSALFWLSRHRLALAAAGVLLASLNAGASLARKMNRHQGIQP